MGGQSQEQFVPPSGPVNMSLPRLPGYAFVPFQTAGADMTQGERFGSDPKLSDSQLKAQRELLEHQIEVLYIFILEHLIF